MKVVAMFVLPRTVVLNLLFIVSRIHSCIWTFPLFFLHNSPTWA